MQKIHHFPVVFLGGRLGGQHGGRWLAPATRSRRSDGLARLGRSAGGLRRGLPCPASWKIDEQCQQDQTECISNPSRSRHGFPPRFFSHRRSGWDTDMVLPYDYNIWSARTAEVDFGIPAQTPSARWRASTHAGNTSGFSSHTRIHCAISVLRACFSGLVCGLAATNLARSLAPIACRRQ